MGQSSLIRIARLADCVTDRVNIGFGERLEYVIIDKVLLHPYPAVFDSDRYHGGWSCLMIPSWRVGFLTKEGIVR